MQFKYRDHSAIPDMVDKLQRFDDYWNSGEIPVPYNRTYRPYPRIITGDGPDRMRTAGRQMVMVQRAVMDEHRRSVCRSASDGLPSIDVGEGTVLLEEDSAVPGDEQHRRATETVYHSDSSRYAAAHCVAPD
jgi:hypothetical protein